MEWRGMKTPSNSRYKKTKYHFKAHGLKVTALELDPKLHAELKRIAREDYDRPLIWLLQNILQAFVESRPKGGGQ
jgi:hypothetical protein